MKTSSFVNRFILSLALLAGLASSAFAVSITYVGGVVATNPANIAEVQGWRSTSVAKTYDALGIHYYGSAGYIMYALDAAGNANAGMAPGSVDPLSWTNSGTTMGTRKSVPSFLTVTNNGQAKVASSYAYPLFDSPTDPIAATVADMESGLGIRDAVAYGTEVSVVSIVLGASFPPNGLRLGIMNGTSNDASGTIRVTQTMGSGGGTATVASVDRGVNVSIYFFDLKQANANDVITIYLTKPSGGNTSVAYTGLTFDLLPSTVMAYETFAGYKPGGLIGQANQGTGFASGTNWFGTNDAFVAPQVNLDWTNGNYSLNMAGGRIETLPEGNGPALFALMDTNLTGAFGKYGFVTNGLIGASNVSGNLYFSFLARDKDGNGNSAADFFGFELFNGSTEVIGIGNSFPASAFSLFWGGNSTDLKNTNGTGGYLGGDNNVHLFVGKIAYQAGASDILSVWMDPDINPATGEAGQGTAVYRGWWTNDATFDRIVLRSGSTDNRKGVEFDEIRFGQSWADVTTVPLIAVQPQSQVGSVGGPVTLSVGASGVRPLTYQ